MSLKNYTRSFAGGEIAPLMLGRLDLGKFQTGLALCENFEVTPQGPVQNRAGFEHIIRARHNDADTVLLPFVYNTEQAYALEFGNGYIRFHTNGATVLEPTKSISDITNASPGVFTVFGHGYADAQTVLLTNFPTGMTSLEGRWATVDAIDANTFRLLDMFGNYFDTSALPGYMAGGLVARVYEVATPYLFSEVYDLHYVQSADVMTIVHRSHTVRELRRLGPTSWTLSEVSFVPTVPTPAAPVTSLHGPGGGDPTFKYYATTAVTVGQQESLASPTTPAFMDLTVAGNYVEIQPSAVAGAVRYNFYEVVSGLLGYIGQTDGSAMKDNNIVPDMTKTPPLPNDPFAQGAIASVTVTAPGSGYGSEPRTGGDITSVTVTSPGTDYPAAPTVTVTGSGSGAVLTANMSGGGVAGINIVNGGALYVGPLISFSAEGETSPATATATAGAIVNHQVTLSVAGGGGSGATLQPVVNVSGEFTGVQVTAPGSGYSSPAVSIVDDAGGAGATFTATVTGTDVNPQAVSYFEQRRVFGGTAGAPQTVWLTRSGTESNMTYSIPTQDDDSISARIVAREAQEVRHLVPLNDLLALTSGGVWRLSAADGGAMTPSSFSAKPQSYIGASMAQPMVANNSVLYVPDRGSSIREVSYSWETQTYKSEDIGVLAPHLFQWHGIRQLAYSRTPHQGLYAVRSDGVLLGLTHQPEHQVQAWQRHTTQGLFQSACVIPEGQEDSLYVIVLRSVNGQVMRYIERQRSRQFEVLDDAFFVDCGATYAGAPATVISGLHHLTGEIASILADGGVQAPRVVVDGQITLDQPASTVHIGLPYTARAKTLPLSVEAANTAFGQGMTKNVNKVMLRMYMSASVKVGPSFTRLTEEAKRLALQPFDTLPGLFTGVANITIGGEWQMDGSVCVQQDQPLPLTLVSLAMETALGG